MILTALGVDLEGNKDVQKKTKMGGVVCDKICAAVEQRRWI
jgi:hypothetical protein